MNSIGEPPGGRERPYEIDKGKEDRLAVKMRSLFPEISGVSDSDIRDAIVACKKVAVSDESLLSCVKKRLSAISKKKEDKEKQEKQEKQ